MGNRQIRNSQVLDGACASVSKSSAVGQDNYGGSGGNLGLGKVGRRLVGNFVESVVLAWGGVKDKNVTCVILALLFSAVFVVPPIMIFGDRSLPVEYGLVYPKSEYLRAGQTGTMVFTVKGEPKKCKGEFSRYFTDSEGNRFFLGTFRTSYQQGLASSLNRRSFEKDWTVPLGAKPGPGLYETEPYFWCNWFQEAYPIAGVPVKVRVNIVLPYTGLGTTLQLGH